MLDVVPKSKESVLFENGSLNIARFEFWFYARLKKLIDDGEVYFKDSLRHRCFDDELVPMQETNDILKEQNLDILNKPISLHLKERCQELDALWERFNDELKSGRLKNLKFDHAKQELIWHRLQAEDDEELKENFYEKLPIVDVVDVLKFVDQECGFLSAFTHLQPKYAKEKPDKDALLGVIVAQGMNYGHFRMSSFSDMRYHILDYTYKQHVRLATLMAASDRATKFISRLPIFEHYYFDFNLLYGAVDGQKYELVLPTMKARSSKKYWGRGKGVVAYTLLANNLPLQTQIIGAHEHESYYMYDILKKNFSGIIPDAISGDMHSINKANFAILSWFGYNFTPRFSDIHLQAKRIYCSKKLSRYKRYLIKPAGQINKQAIIDGWPQCKRLMASLASKEVTQSVIMKKLCSYGSQNKLRKAVFEYDKLERSIYTLKYFLDVELQRNVNRSQNRIEAYHQLRSTIASVNGRKELLGRTDIAVEISNQCGRLIATGLICYNAILASYLLLAKKLKHNKLLSKISPIAWRHVHFQGQYSFKTSKKALLNPKTIFKNVDINTILTSKENAGTVSATHDLPRKSLKTNKSSINTSHRKNNHFSNTS